MSKKTITKIIFIGLIGLIGLAPTHFLAKGVFAQSDLEAAIKKYNIQFPIAALGNCADFNACYKYCDDPANRESCIKYAEEKGFYDEDKAESQMAQSLQEAKSELGCDGEESCRTFCDNEANFEKCTEFAKSHDLGGGQILSPKNQEILSKAKEILGCDSPSVCKGLCEKEEYREKCSEFARQTGLKGGEERVGPGGCNSEETCRAYCSDRAHAEECMKFGPPPEGSEGPPRGMGEKAPGGCQSEEECRKYCDEHPDECKGFGPPGEEWKGPGYESGEDYCEKNPGACPGPGAEDQMRREGESFGPPPESDQDQLQFEQAPPQEGAPQDQAPTQTESSTVQGIRTIRSLLQVILDFILGRHF